MKRTGAAAMRQLIHGWSSLVDKTRYVSLDRTTIDSVNVGQSE